MRSVRFLYVAIFALALIFLPLQAHAVSSTVLITELQVGSDTSASDEFVELYNPSDMAIDISGWLVYYKSATGKTWTKKATVPAGTVLQPKQYWVISSEPDGDSTLNSGFAQTSGNVQLRDNTGHTVDQIAWGEGDSPLGAAIPSPAVGEIIYREFDATAALYVDTQDNFNDYGLATSATPHAATIITPTTDTNPTSYPSLRINELLPNPASPQSDTTDEFIELFNPNGQDVNLKGWRLRDSGGAVYTIGDITLPASGYITFMSSETKLSLNNSGDSIDLLAPNGDVIDQSEDYGEAKEGLSWAVVGSSWSWTTSPTPNSANSAAIAESAETSMATTGSKTTKKAKATVAKTKTSKAASSKKAADAKKSPIAAIADKATESTKNTNFWGWLLVLAGAATIGYGIYEYRTEISNIYHRCREALIARRANRPTTS
jgi:hypothetical protein